MPGLAKELDALAVVTDMSPLRDPSRWAREVAEDLSMAGDRRPLFQVDKTNVILESRLQFSCPHRD